MACPGPPKHYPMSREIPCLCEARVSVEFNTYLMFQVSRGIWTTACPQCHAPLELHVEEDYVVYWLCSNNKRCGGMFEQKHWESKNWQCYVDSGVCVGLNPPHEL